MHVEHQIADLTAVNTSVKQDAIELNGTTPHAKDPLAVTWWSSDNAIGNSRAYNFKDASMTSHTDLPD